MVPIHGNGDFLLYGSPRISACAHTGTEPKYIIANTGMGTTECQYWLWTVPILVLKQSTKFPILVWASFLNASTGNGLCLSSSLGNRTVAGSNMSRISITSFGIQII
jgi:hypothetical protein